VGKLIFRAIFWLIRKLGLLLLLVGVLVALPWVTEAWKVARDFNPAEIATDAVLQVQQITPTKQSGQAEVKKKLAALRAMRSAKEAERESVEKTKCLLPTCSYTKDAKLYRFDTEIEILSQAINYSEALLNGGRACGLHKSLQPILEFQQNLVNSLNEEKPWWVPKAQAHLDAEERLRDLQAEASNLDGQCKAFRIASASFAANKSKLDGALKGHQAFLQRMAELAKLKIQLEREALAVLPQALLLLLSILLGPVGIKALAYWGIAPLASRRFGFTLAKDSTGEIAVLAKNDRLQQIDLSAGEELLIAPVMRYRDSGNLDVKMGLLLDGKAPFTSIAAGMFNLSKYSAISPAYVGLNVKDSNNDKLCVILIPDGSSLVLQPRFLAGVVQTIERPIRITRHWRLFDPASWLTLQLRYMVFHGPAKLILKGCNGVQVDPVQEGTKINQASTIGFTANLHYSVSRSEPFFPYLGGKQELFDDHFSGSTGYFVHEVSPKPSKSTLLPGRGIEGILNSILKIFGI
jgi:hypothetical protein